jgi:hypothetical protein
MSGDSIGRLDINTWLAFRKAKGAERRRLLDQLVRDNEPLTIVLTAQMCGRGENRPGRRQKFKREPYVELLSVEEQEAAGRIGMMKALDRFDPAIRDAVRKSHGLAAADDPAKGLPAFAAWRIKFELQQAIEKAGCLTIRRGVAPQGRPGVERLDDPDRVETVLTQSQEYLGSGEESLKERFVREWNEDQAKKKGDGRERPTSAIAHFIETRCRFRHQFLMARETVFGLYTRHARWLGFGVVSTKALETAILTRPRVRLLRGRDPTGGTRYYFRGVEVLTLREVGRRVETAEV